MNKKMFSDYPLTKTILIILDALLALIIIFTAKAIVSTQFGRVSLIFGFIMLSITTILRIMQKW